MSDFRAKILAELDTSKAESQLKALESGTHKIKIDLDLTSTNSALMNMLGKLTQQAQSAGKNAGGGFAQSFSSSIKQIYSSIDTKKFEAQIASLKNKMSSYDVKSNEYGQLSKTLSDVTKQYNELVVAKEKFNNDATAANGDALIKANTSLTESIKKANNEMKLLTATQSKLATEQQKAAAQKSFTSYFESNTKAAKKYSDQIKTLQEQLSKVKTSDDLSKFKTDFTNLQTQIMKNGDLGKSFSDQFTSMASAVGKFAASYISIQTVISAVKDAASSVVELDSALTNISYTMNLSTTQMKSISDSAVKMSTDLSASMTNVLESMKLYANANESAESITEKAKTAVMMSNVTGMGSTDTAKMLQSVMNQFDLTQNDLMYISDTIQSVSQNMAYDFSSGINEISEGIKVSGSVAKDAGLDLAQYSAMLGLTIEQTGQSGSTIGRAYSTIFQRITKASKASGTLEEDISKAEESLRSAGIEVRKNDGEFRELDDILYDLAGAWDNLTDVQRNNIAYNVAGTRQTNVLKTLMANYQDYLDMVEKAENSTGVTEANQAKWADSLAGKIQEMKSLWQSLAFDEGFQSTVSGVIDFGTKVSTVITGIIKNFGLLKSAIVGLAFAKVIKTAFDIGGIKSFSDMTTVLATAFPKIASGLSNLKSVASSASSAFSAAGGGIKGLSAAASAGASSLSLLGGAMAALAVVGVIAFGVQQYKQHLEELRQAALDAGNEFKNSQTTLSDYATRIEELRNKIADKKTTEAEAYQAEKELLDIQNELASSAGQYIGQIDLVNGSLTEQLGLLQKINAQNADSFLNENSKAIETAKAKMTGTLGGDGNWFLEAGKVIGTFTDSYSAETEKIKEIVAKYKDNLQLDDMGNGELRLRFVGDATEATSVLNSFMTDLRYAKEEVDSTDMIDGLFDGAGSVLNDANEIISKYKEIYDAAMQAQMISESYGKNKKIYTANGIDKTSAEWLNDYTNAVERYNEALASGDPSKITEARTEFESLDGAISALMANEDFAQYAPMFEEIKAQLNEAAVNAQDFNDALNGKNVESGTKSLKEYADQLKELKMTDVEFADKFLEGLGEDEISDAIQNIIDEYAQLYGLDPAELTQGQIEQIAASLVNAGVLVHDASLDVAEGVEEMASSVDTYKTALENAKTVQADLQTAINNSNSATGMAAEEVDKVTSAFKGLDNFNPDALFERTENGIRLNTDALKQYNAELEAQTKQGFMDAIIEKQNELNEAQANNASADVVSGLEAELRQLKNLAAEYDGLTSKFNAYMNATSSANNRDSFAAVASGYEAVGQLIEQGWVTDDSVTSYLDLMLGVDRIQDSQQAYAQLGKTIEGTTHSLKDYFTTDAKGNLTSQGAWQFVDDIATKLGSDFVSIGKDGSYALDLTGDKLQTVADEFGTTTEFVELLGRALADAGMNVNFDSDEVMNYNEQMKKLTEQSDQAHKALQDLQNTSEGGILGDIDFNYDKASMSIDEVQSKIEELTSKRNEIDVSTEEGQQAVALLDSEIQALNNQKVMLEIGAQLEGGATVDELLALSDEDLQKTLHINTDEVETARSQLESLQTNEVDIPVTVKLDESQFSALTGTGDTTVNVTPVVTEQPKFDDATVNVTAECTTPPSVPDATGTANMELGESPTEVPDASGIANYTLGDHPTEAPAISGIANYSASFNFPLTAPTIYGTAVYTKTGVASGTMTAHADGTAYNMLNTKRISPSYAKGDVTLQHNEQALVNEIGQESIVRDGVWYMLPAKPHIENLKKGDIVFSAKQTSDLLNHGRANNYARALAGGTLNAYGLTGTGNNPWKTGGSVNTGATTTSNRTTVSSNSSYSSAGSSNSTANSSSSKASDDFEKEFDWVEVALNRISEAIDRVKVKAESAYKTLAHKNAAAADEIVLVAQSIELQNKAYTKYMQEANALGLSSDWIKKIQDGSIELSKITDEDLADKIQEYQDLYEKAIKAKDAVAELKEQIADLYLDKFNNIVENYENQLSLIEHMTKTYEEGINQLEEAGMLGATAYYKYLMDEETKSVKVMQNELATLEKALEQAMQSGEIEMYSDAWYEMMGDINDVRESIDEATTSLLKYQKAMRELEWDYFDFTEDNISNIVTETEFLIDLLSNKKLFDDNGQMTDEGQAVMGLHGENYNVYMAQADDYAEEIKKLNAEIANDPTNTDLLKRRQELVELQQKAILNAEKEKEAIVDLVSDGYDKQLSALKDIISAYTDSLDSAKDLYDYQKKVKKQTQDIATLQKQLAAYSNDTSEETQAKVQKLQVDLSEAMEDLEETQYERYIADQKKLLDDLYSEYETVLNNRIDDVDALIGECIGTINAESGNISDTITREAGNVGYTISEANKAIWANDGEANSIIAKYGTQFSSQLTSINSAINGIKAYTDTLLAKANAEAAAKKAAEEAARKKAEEASKPKTPAPAPQQPAKQDDSSTKFNEDVKRGIAAAIWIYGGAKSGWGNDPERKQKLTAKFGATNAAAVQSYINAHANNGDLYNYWISTGKNNLSKYYYSAFKTGAKRITKAQDAWTQEAGRELILSPSRNAMLTSMEPGDSVLTSQMTDNIWRLAKNPEQFIGTHGIVNVGGMFDGSAHSIGSNGVSMGDINITIPIDHIEDYDDFVEKLKNDGKFEKMIQAMTVGRLAGGSKLEKQKYQWK